MLMYFLKSHYLCHKKTYSSSGFKKPSQIFDVVDISTDWNIKKQPKILPTM